MKLKRDAKLFICFIVLATISACGFEMQTIRLHDPRTGDELICKPSDVPEKMECTYALEGGKNSGSFLVDKLSVDSWLKNKEWPVGN